MDAHEVDGRDWDRKPTRNPTSVPARSAAKLVSAKCSKKSRGSMAAIGRPPHQSSTTAITAPWSDGRSARIVTAALSRAPESPSAAIPSHPEVAADPRLSVSNGLRRLAGSQPGQ
jgi:hypothetical protein